jgi:hypothetical protein
VKLRNLVLFILAAALVSADPVVHQLEVWGTFYHLNKIVFYIGWTNGYFAGKGEPSRDLAFCLNSMSMEQAVAMIDKYYKDNPARWSELISFEIPKALTVVGGPCEGKNPSRNEKQSPQDYGSAGYDKAVRDHVRVTLLGAGRKEPVLEQKVGDSLFRETETWSYREMTIDRERDWYRELIVDRISGAVLRRCDEPLSAHRGRGSARKSGSSSTTEPKGG